MTKQEAIIYCIKELENEYLNKDSSKNLHLPLGLIVEPGILEQSLHEAIAELVCANILKSFRNISGYWLWELVEQ